jgi:multiple sugar transport system ATP-binding protein
MTLGDRVAVMNSGRIQQVATPQRLYHEPADMFVASFMGSRSMNLVEAEIVDDHVRFAGFGIALAPGRRPAGMGAGRVVLGIRPQDLHDADEEPSLPVIEVEPVVIEELGSGTHVIFPIEALPVSVDAVLDADAELEERAVLIASDTRALFTAELNESTQAKVGERLRLAVDASRFHFFAPDTGRAIRGEAAAVAQP